MNAEVAIIKTAAETALAQEFAQAHARLPGGKAIAAQRAAAFNVFAREGLPHRRIEEWKYTDLRALMRDAKPLAAPPDAKAKTLAKSAGALLGDVETRRLVFVDGAFVAELSDTAALEPGLSVASLADALAGGDPVLAAHLGKLAPASDVAVALNTALMGDGAVIRIAAGSTTGRPIHLLFVASEKPAATFTRREWGNASAFWTPATRTCRLRNATIISPTTCPSTASGIPCGGRNRRVTSPWKGSTNFSRSTRKIHWRFIG